jgi:hypothetical protein
MRGLANAQATYMEGLSKLYYYRGLAKLPAGNLTWLLSTTVCVHR